MIISLKLIHSVLKARKKIKYLHILNYNVLYLPRKYDDFFHIINAWNGSHSYLLTTPYRFCMLCANIDEKLIYRNTGSVVECKTFYLIKTVIF